MEAADSSEIFQQSFCKESAGRCAIIRSMMRAETPVSPAERQTRRSLIGRLRNLDDRESWQAFFDAYWKLIYSVARKAGCTESEAEEVVQETIMAVAKYIQDFQYDPEVCSFKNWLLHKTRWKIIDQVRKRSPGFVQRFAPTTDTSRTPTVERMPDPESLELDAVWDEEWQANLIKAAMERVKHRVKPEHYQIFFLSAVRKLGPKRVAATLGVSMAQVYLVNHRVAGLIKKEIAVLERNRF
jgi:RNA polymerase sigma factor (sigma-70 family)